MYEYEEEIAKMASAFRPATASEYIEWLCGYLAEGGEITHVYNYPMRPDGFVMAIRNFTTNGECGSRSLNIIVPAGVYHLDGRLGHNNLYFMDGFRTDDESPFIPAHSNPEFDRVPGIDRARIKEARRSAEFWAKVQALKKKTITADLKSDVAAYREFRSRSWQR